MGTMGCLNKGALEPSIAFELWFGDLWNKEFALD